jgi:hypothetical protein
MEPRFAARKLDQYYVTQGRVGFSVSMSTHCDSGHISLTLIVTPCHGAAKQVSNPDHYNPEMAEQSLDKGPDVRALVRPLNTGGIGMPNFVQAAGGFMEKKRQVRVQSSVT